MNGFNVQSDQVSRREPLWQQQRERTGTVLIAALFVMSVSSIVILAILESQTSHWAALNSTVATEHSLFLAETGVAHGLAILEADNRWRGTVSRMEFPAGSGHFYGAVIESGENGAVVVTGTGETSNTTRTVTVTVKKGA